MTLQTSRLLAASLVAMGLGLSAPVMAAAPVIDNDRVTVWEVILNKGETGPAAPPNAVVMFLEGGTIRTTGADGKTSNATRQYGDATFATTGARDTLVSGGPAREIIVSLKNHPKPPTANTSGLPPAFPRAGSVKMLENAQLVVWHYTWEPGKPSPMHFHDKDVVVAYRYDGTVKSTAPDGTVTENHFKPGEVRFNLAKRTHSELLTGARQSAVMLELK